jgi:hypothetical protein
LGWLDPRTLVQFFKEHNIKAWLDIQEVNSSTTLFAEITKGINKASVVVACLSDEYTNSVNCKLEFRFAHTSLKVPIIKAICGTGNVWRQSELAFLSGIYPEVNFQYENKGKNKFQPISKALKAIFINVFHLIEAHDALLNLVQEELEKVRAKKEKQESMNNKNKEQEEINNSNVAYQELYELTQRKFLKKLNTLCEKMHNSVVYPRLFCIDLIEKEKLDKFISIKKMLEKRELHAELRIIDSDSNANRPSTASAIDENKPQTFINCLRPMCEFDEGWHLSETLIPLHELNPSYYAYLARVMNIIKNGHLSNELLVFLTEHGNKLMIDIETKVNSKLEKDLAESYTALRSLYIKEFDADGIYSLSNNIEKESELKSDLKRCELKNGRILWLCNKHILETNARELTELKSNLSSNIEANKKFLEDLETISLDII